MNYVRFHIKQEQKYDIRVRRSERKQLWNKGKKDTKTTFGLSC